MKPEHRHRQKQRPRSWQRLALGLLAGLGLSGPAQAATVKIVDAGSLELRRIEGQELVVIGSGQVADENGVPSLVQLEVDGDVLLAERVEFNRTARTLTLVGNARYTAEGQTLTGDNLVVNLTDQALSGADVLVRQGNLTIRGEELQRVPGQLQAMGSYFSPCGGCGQTPDDYAFQAEQLVLYPGDRLVAYRVQVLLAGHPVLYLPVIVIPLNEPARQPRLSVEQGDLDGLTVAADLPFSVAGHTLGTTLLRYYEHRPAKVGVGVDLHSYAPSPFVDRADLYFLSQPRPFVGTEPQEGRESDLEFSVRGRVPLELAVRDLDYDFALKRRDIGRTATDPLRGVTDLRFGARVEYPLFSGALNVQDLWNEDKTRAVYVPLKFPEVVIDPKPYVSDGLSLDLKLTAGQYTAQSNPDSPSALREGPNVTTSRIEEEHRVTYARPLWEGADLKLSNEFTGRYYGTGARTVDLELKAEVNQRFGEDGEHRATFRSEYYRYEGTSPFAFDRLQGRRLSAPQSLELSLQPASDVTVTARHTHDLYRPWDEQAATAFGARVNRYPVQFSGSFSPNFYQGDLENGDFNLTLGGTARSTLTAAAGRALSDDERLRLQREAQYAWLDHLALSVSGGYTESSGLRPLTVKATVTGDTRADNFSVYATHDVKTPQLREIGLDASLTRSADQVVNPLTFTTSQRLHLIDQRVNGNVRVLWRGEYALEERHNLRLNQVAGAKNSGDVTFSVGTRGTGRASNWELAYGGPFDLPRFYWTEPTLRGTYAATEPGQRLRATATLNLPGLEQQRTELAQLSLDGEWQPADRFSVSGRASYTRTRSAQDIPTDRLTFSPLAVAVGLGPDPKPEAYLTGRLEQTFVWVDGELQDPASPRPIIGLVLDRCCWAARAEADVTRGAFRFSVGLPGQNFQPLFDYSEQGLDVPLLPDF